MEKSMDENEVFGAAENAAGLPASAPAEGAADAAPDGGAAAAGPFKPGRSNFSRRKRGEYLFVACMLAYPLIQFIIMWAFVNIDSVIMSFQRYDSLTGETTFSLNNFETWVQLIGSNEMYGTMVVNSLLHSVVGMFVIFPLCLIMTYFLCRKVPGSGFFRIVFYLPSIIPLVVLGLAFREGLMNSNGIVGKLCDLFGTEPPAFFSGGSITRVMVYVFCVWIGLGGNTLLLSGAIKRVPTEVLEAAHLDGVKTWREFIQIVIPMCWPTIVTLFVMSMMGVFSVVFQPYFMTSSVVPETLTIGLQIFLNAGAPGQQESVAALGLLATVCVAPVVLVVRWLLDRFFRDVEY